MKFFPGVILSLFLLSKPIQAIDQVCLDCHSDPTLATKKNGKTISLFIKSENFQNSVHGANGCTSCHVDVDEKNLPHDAPLQKVDCGNCHDRESEQHDESLHGLAFKQGDPYAPTCVTCHGTHYILPKTNPQSNSYVMNIPIMCGRCHKEGSDMVKIHDIPEKDIINNYTESIHGEGLLVRGLIGTAVCTSCHTAHFTLPHTDARSSIHRNNIAGTCMQCHALIEQVHTKVVRGELWEKRPDDIPACIDCHSPHKIRRVFYIDTMNDAYCLRCHSQPDLIRTWTDGSIDSLYVNLALVKASAHGTGIECIKCHVNVSNLKDPVCKDSGPVDCSICHAQAVVDHQTSTHGQLLAANDPNAPSCRVCHGTHFIQTRQDLTSPIFPRNIPQLCGKCHRSGEAAARRIAEGDTNIVQHYTESIHGKGLLQSGLLVSATCTNCHTSHLVLPPIDPRSRVNPKNIAATCANCHLGIYEEFKASIHSPLVSRTDQKLPTCSDCHTAHGVARVDELSFRQQILAECGTCHQDETENYFETYHGKTSLLGAGQTAKCSDCHGAHNILPVSNPKSMLSRQNIIETCKKCHPNSNRQFTGYLTHATHHNRHKYPFLFYTFWAMTGLLGVTFLFFGIHTLLWLPRSFAYRFKLQKQLRRASKSYYVRFERVWRILHIIVIVSFFGLAVTGMLLKFAGTNWSVFFANFFGGFENAGLIHRFCAGLTFFYFVVHFIFVYKNWKKSGKSLRQFIFGQERSLVPTRQDVKELFQTLRWFFTGKNRPNYGRWTYWEKFDYLAVFWGVAMIGFTGLFLWFPEFFTKFLPGYFINIATIIHSDEALLATGFIFAYHFFNTHFRPEKFPMDPVIFTGKIPLEEFKHDRPREYELVKAEGTLRKKLEKAPPRWLTIWSHVFGIACLIFGYALIGMIIWAMIFKYK